MGKLAKFSREEQAARVVWAVISAGLVVKGHGECPAGTVGPYHRAVGPAVFALFGYGLRVPAGYQAREEDRAIAAARLFVSCVGAPRARDAAMRTPNRPPLSTAAEDIARRHAEHARTCRKVYCMECGVGR